MKKFKHLLMGASGFVLLSATQAFAAPVFWTDWILAGTNFAVGSLPVGSSSAGVMFSGSYQFAQTSGGTNYWNPGAPYLSATVSNAPPASDIIALNRGGIKTITFSESVHNPLIALVSWNGNTVDFGVPINVLSYGGGYWGNGTPIMNLSGTGFFGNGEVHGVIELPGDYTSISFQDTSENWHGITVGVKGLTSIAAVPEPSALALLGLGALGLAMARRRTRA